MSVATQRKRKSTKRHSGTLAPRVSPWLLAAFHLYLRNYLARHFHAIRVSQASPLDIWRDEPLVVYCNHSAWWDPLIGLVLAKHCFTNHTLHAPVDAAALGRYGILKSLGFFGAERETRRGASQFLQLSRTLLDRPGASIWLTPEGRFTDPRERDLPFQPGLAHLVSEMERGAVVPIAIEYPFWEDRLPEALVRIGAPKCVADHPFRTKLQWQESLEEALRSLQDELAELSIARRSDAFEVLLAGRGGVGALTTQTTSTQSMLGEGLWGTAVSSSSVSGVREDS